MHTKFLVSITLAVFLVSMLAGCGPQPPTLAPTNAGPADTVVAPTTAPTTEPTAAVPTVYGGLPRNETFIIGHQFNNSEVWDAYNTFVDAMANSCTGFKNAIEEMPFLTFNGKLYPYLAQSWQYNADGTEFTLTITTGANWNDGTPLTMDDWLFSLDFFKQWAGKGIEGGSFFPEVASYEAVGDNQILFKLTAPDFRFHNNFIATICLSNFYPIAKHIWEGQDPTTFKNPTAVGSGPFILKSCNADTKVCILERRDDYYNKDAMPAMKYLVFTEAPALDLSTLEWANGNYDLGNLPLSNVKSAEAQNPNISTFESGNPCPPRMAFNMAKPPLDDVAVRHALSLLLDRQKINNQADVPGQIPVIFWPYAGQPDPKFYDPAAATQYDLGVFDPQKAAQILDDAGYKLVDGKRIDPKTGKPLVFTVTTSALGYTFETAFPQVFKEGAATVGIEIDPRDLEMSSFLTAGPLGDFDITYQWFCSDASDPIGVYTDLLSSNAMPIGKSNGVAMQGLNIYRYNNPELDALVVKMQAGSIEDPAIQALYRQAYAIVARDMPFSMVWSEGAAMPINLQYWTGLQNQDMYVYWCTHFQQMLRSIKSVPQP
ncbi:MAG TPA: ABC transporter substrate-binding protein [Anaerolineales bacterium]